MFNGILSLELLNLTYPFTLIWASIAWRFAGCFTWLVKEKDALEDDLPRKGWPPFFLVDYTFAH